jgi:hypothetical protein
MKQTITCLIFLISSGTQISKAQTFNKGNLSPISTGQIIQENYLTIRLNPEQVADPKANLFDISNTDTHLQVLIDNSGRKYHILLQTNFTGRVTFLSISNNLSIIFNKKDKPMFIFDNCIQDLNTFILPKQNIETAIKCVIERLEYCSR